MVALLIWDKNSHLVRQGPRKEPIKRAGRTPYLRGLISLIVIQKRRYLFTTFFTISDFEGRYQSHPRRRPLESKINKISNIKRAAPLDILIFISAVGSYFNLLLFKMISIIFSINLL